MILVDGEGDNGVYFLSFVGQNVRIHQLIIPDSGKGIEWLIIGEIPDSVNNIGMIPTKAALFDNNIYFQGGKHGCG